MTGSESVSTTHLADLRDGQQRLDDVLVERFAGQRAVVLAGHALAVVAHGDEGKELRHLLFQ